MNPGLRLVRAMGRLGVRLAVLGCWLLIMLLALLTWGPHATRFKTDIIIGRSMEPTIPLYSVIVAEPVDVADIRPGDVITYQQPDQPERKVTHRVERIERAGDGSLAFVTRGDANEVRDPYRVTYRGIGYRVRTHVPHVGWVMIQAQTRGARVLLVVVPVLVIFLQFMRWLWREEPRQPDDGVGAGAASSA